MWCEIGGTDWIDGGRAWKRERAGGALCRARLFGRLLFSLVQLELVLGRLHQPHHRGPGVRAHHHHVHPRLVCLIEGLYHARLRVQCWGAPSPAWRTGGDMQGDPAMRGSRAHPCAADCRCMQAGMLLGCVAACAGTQLRRSRAQTISALTGRDMGLTSAAADREAADGDRCSAMGARVFRLQKHSSRHDVTEEVCGMVCFRGDHSAVECSTIQWTLNRQRCQWRQA